MFIILIIDPNIILEIVGLNVLIAKLKAYSWLVSSQAVVRIVEAQRTRWHTCRKHSNRIKAWIIRLFWVGQPAHLWHRYSMEGPHVFFCWGPPLHQSLVSFYSQGQNETPKLTLLQHVGFTNIITETNDPHVSKCFGPVIFETIKGVCSHSYFENAKGQPKKFSERSDLLFAMGKNLARCWLPRLKHLHSSVVDVVP